MSVDRPSPLTDDHDRNPKPTKERSSAPDQKTIEQRLKHLKEEVLPFYPFLLTVPTDVPFRLGGHFVNNWAVGNDGPFTLEEHQLQYMTFLTHHEGDSLLVAVGDWSDGAGSIMSDQRPGLQSAANTPSSGATKKKISLNDYKNKWKDGASDSPVFLKTTSQGASTSRALDDKHQDSKASQSQQSTPKPTNARSPPQNTFENATGRKRPPDPETEHVKPNNKEHSERRFAKKLRLSPDQTADKKSDPPKTNGLPVLLSPTLPTLPPTSDSSNLPQLLSPTLPPSIEKELASIHDEPLAEESSRKAANSVFEGVAEDRAKLASANLDALHSDFTRSPSMRSKSPDVPSQIVNKSSLPGVALGSHLPPENSKKTSSRTGSAQQQLIVKLKYGKSNKKRVEALLKFTGKKKTATLGSPNKKEDRTLSMQPKSEEIMPISHRPEKKQKQPSSDEPPSQLGERSKERKPATSDKPRTPVHVPSQQGKPKQITPAKDLKHTSSRLLEPTDSDGNTPFNQGSKYHPGGSSANTKLSPPQSFGQSRNGERRAWKDDYQKYGNLGRELKHAADRHTAKDDVKAADEKIAAATALEAILCFILAFVADDQSKALARQVGDSSAWISILAYWRVVKKNSVSHPQLYNLCLILGAVSYDAIHALDLDRLAISPFPGEHTLKPVTSEGAHSLEESKKSRKELHELKTRLPECYKESQRLWAEGMKGLSEDILDREFPTTWRNRCRRYSERGRLPSKAGDYSGGYFLPLGKTDTPVEVVRFGWSLLKEWCTKEGLHWHGRLNL